MLHNDVNRKFIETIKVDEWEIEGADGWVDIEYFNITVPYEVWEVILEDGTTLKGADNHIFITADGDEIYLKDSLGIQLTTKNGPMRVETVVNLEFEENMYDISVGGNHTYYANGILNHNTTVAAAYLLWYAMFIPDSTILIASKTGTDSKEIMQKIRYAYEELPNHIRAGAKEYNKHSVVFDNNSRIISTTTTENTGRGMALSLVYLDEFAFVNPPSIAEELWTSLSPTLSTGGKCMITSTPNSESDTFAKIWFDAINVLDEYGNYRNNGLGINGFKSYFADWTANPERDEVWAEQERAKIGDDRFAREHLCRFVTFEETLINSSHLSKMNPTPPLNIDGHVRWYSEIDPKLTYVVALDPSMGTGGDFAAIEVFELPSFKQVGEWQHNRTIIENQMKILMQILKDISSKGVQDLYWSVESNSLGEAAMVVIRDKGEESFPGTMLHDNRRDISSKKGRMGFVTTNKSKLEACSRLKSMLESGKMQLNSVSLISELKNFIAKGVTYEARSGSTDDLVSAVLLFLRMAQYIATWDDESQKRMSSNTDDADDSGAPLPMLFC